MSIRHPQLVRGKQKRNRLRQINHSFSSVFELKVAAAPDDYLHFDLVHMDQSYIESELSV